MNTEERMTPEVIDVDEYEPEIEVVAQGKRAYFALRIPTNLVS